MDPMATSSTKAKASSDYTGEPDPVPLTIVQNAKIRSPDMGPMATTSTQHVLYLIDMVNTNRKKHFDSVKDTTKPGEMAIMEHIISHRYQV